MWLPLMDLLQSHFHCIAVELRGFGGSTFDRQYTIRELAQDVEIVRSHLNPDETFHLVGLSMGGYVALEYWHQYSHHLRSLVLVNTRASSDDAAGQAMRNEMAQQALENGAWQSIAPMLSKLISRDLVGTQIEATVKEMMQSVDAISIAAAQVAMAGRRDFSSLIGHIRVPTLVVTGEHDPIAPPVQTSEWARQIPKANYHVVPGSGHLSPLEKTEEFCKVLREFIAGV